MEQKLNQDRYLRRMSDPGHRARDKAITRIQASYGYDYENAEKVYEIMRIKQVEQLFGCSMGALAVYKVLPVIREMEASHAIMRKAWMRYPLLATAFGSAFFVGVQLPVRFFSKLTHRHEQVTHENYYGRNDLVGRFRAFEEQKGTSAEDELLDHLSMYDKDPLSKP